MIFVCCRGSKEGENAVTSGLRHVTAIVMNRVNHQLECRIDKRARLFGVEVLYQLHRALDVGEQRRDRLALAVQSFRGGRVGHPNR